MKIFKIGIATICVMASALGMARGFDHQDRSGRIRELSAQVNKTFGPEKNLKIGRTFRLFGQHQGKNLEYVELDVEKLFSFGRDRSRRERGDFLDFFPPFRGPVTATLVINGRETRNQKMIYGRDGLNTIRFTLYRPHKKIGADIHRVQIKFDKPVFIYDAHAGVSRKGHRPFIIEKRVNKVIDGRERIALSELLSIGYRLAEKQVKTVTLTIRNHSARGKVKLCHYSERPRQCQDKVHLQEGRNEVTLQGHSTQLMDLDLIARGSFVIKKIKVKTRRRPRL